MTINICNQNKWSCWHSELEGSLYLETVIQSFCRNVDRVIAARGETTVKILQEISFTDERVTSRNTIESSER